MMLDLPNLLCGFFAAAVALSHNGISDLISNPTAGRARPENHDAHVAQLLSRDVQA